MTCRDSCCRPDEEGECPPTCILTGAPGENPDDCTTHRHEEEPEPDNDIGYDAFPSESWYAAKAQMESDERLYRQQRDRSQRGK